MGTCGHPAVDAEVRVAAEDAPQCSSGDINRMKVRAPFQMPNDFHADDVNTEMITADGWIWTRDLARQDETAYLYLVNWRNGMIVTGSCNTYPWPAWRPMSYAAIHPVHGNPKPLPVGRS
jgi:non-ribosomal peptide synthetase component E (peptide arylation enzyme)